MIVYLIRNLVNGKVYVGKTEKTLEERFKRHLSSSSSCSLLSRALRKYGIDAFEVRPICSAFSRDALNYLEQIVIAQFGSIAPNGYNLTFGGEGGGIPSEAARLSLSEAHRGKPRSEETKRRIGAAQKGKTLSQEHRQNLSRAKKGKPWTERMRMSRQERTMTKGEQTIIYTKPKEGGTICPIGGK